MRPTIICLCGSLRFKTEFEQINKALTFEGNIVLSVGCFDFNKSESDVKFKLDLLHFQKILLADEIFVINPGGYIGQSTANEILFAHQAGKEINFLSEFITVTEANDKIKFLFRN